MPTDGGPTVGSPIDQGTYAISELEAGKYQVIIAGYDSTQFAESSADLEAAAKSGGARTQSFRDLAQGAEGNNIEVEILAGSQVLDFPLKSR